MKKLTLFPFILTLLCVLKLSLLPAQNGSVQSLENIAASLTNDTIRINTLIEFSQSYQDSLPDKAFDYGFKALVIASHLNYLPGKAKAHNNLGDLYWYKNDYVSSDAHYQEALKIFEELKDMPAIADCYRNIGWIYISEGRNQEALQLHSKALRINLELGLAKEAVRNYNDAGLSYYSLNIHDSAMEHLCEAIAIGETLEFKTGLAVSYDNIAQVYNKLGNNWLAIDNMLQSLRLSEEIGNHRYQADCHSFLSMLYLKDSNFNEAAASLERAAQMAKRMEDKSLLKKYYVNFASLYALNKDFKSAAEYVNLASALADTIFEEGNRRQHQEMITKYESEKKMLALNSLLKDKDVFAEMLSREKKLKIYSLIFCLMVVVFAVFLYRNNMLKQKMNKALERTSHEIEEKNKSITDSILYSKHIQDVCLPSKQMKDLLFKDAFILFQPKDIVSGDFYWYNEKNGKRLIASCDCTGHGVPGALMSMIGNNILNQIVNVKALTAPDEVLNRLNYEMRKTLKQENEEANSKDGMDIAFITFNSETEIEYAGANRPLWIVKQNKPLAENGITDETAASNAELVEYKPDKLSIGGYQSESVKPFKKHVIQLSKGDCLYIFSDGYADQFGGPGEKRLSSRRFKELLLANAYKSVAEQEIALRRMIKEWKGDNEQIDDILVIGIKI